MNEKPILDHHMDEEDEELEGKNWKERNVKFEKFENILNFGTNKIGMTHHGQIYIFFSYKNKYFSCNSQMYFDKNGD